MYEVPDSYIDITRHNRMMEDPLVPLQIVRDLTEGELQASAAAAATVEAV